MAEQNVRQILMPNMDAAIPMFSGLPKESFSDFLRRFEISAEEYNWSENAKILWFSARLSGDARRKWDFIFHNNESLKFNDMLEQFKGFFKEKEDLSKSMFLIPVKYNSEEDIFEFRLKIENSVKNYVKNKCELNSPEGKKMFAVTALEEVIKAVPTDWKEKIYRAEIKDYEEVIKFLEKEEKLARKIKEINSLENDDKNEGELEEILKKKDKKIAMLEESLNAMRLNRGWNRSHTQREFCNYCKMNGHSYVNCRRRNWRSNGGQVNRALNYGNFRGRERQVRREAINKQTEQRQNFLE